MRKTIITTICSVLFIFQSVPAFGQELTGNYATVFGYTAETNGKTDVASWSTCEGDVATNLVAIKRKNSAWTSPISVGTSICSNWPNVAIKNDGRIFVFWQDTDGITFTSSKSAKSNIFNPPAKLPKSAGITETLQNWTYANGKNFTFVAAVVKDSRILAYSWDLTGNKWKRKLIADLMPASEFQQCDLSLELVCDGNVTGMYLAGNAKGQISVAFGVQLTTTVNDVQTQKGVLKVFERKSVSTKWVRSGTLLDYTVSPIDYANFWPSSVAVSPKGKTVVTFSQYVDFGVQKIGVAYSAGFNKTFSFKDQTFLDGQTSNQDGFATFKGEKPYLMFTGKTDADAALTAYFGKIGSLTSAEVVAKDANCTGFGIVGGKFKAVLVDMENPMSDRFFVYTKGTVGWNRTEIIQSTNPNYGPLTWGTWGYVSHGKLVVRAIGFFEDGFASNVGPGFYVEVIG